MKYTIEGFNQRNAIAMGLSAEDLILLRWIIDFKEDGTMKKKYISNINDMGYWVSYKYAIKELPILFSMPPHIVNKDYSTRSLGEKKLLNKKWLNACRKKLQRMLSGNLSKVLSRDLSKERVKTENGQELFNTFVYIYINSLTYRFLISDKHGLFKETDTVNKSNKSVDSLMNTVDKKIEFTAGQKCPTVTAGQKCPTVTAGQKCPVDSSINILYSSTNTSEKNTSEKKQLENHPNVKIFRENTGLKNTGRDFYKSITEWDYDKLAKALEEYKNKKGYSFSFLKDIYNNLNTSNTSKPALTKFHNCNNSFDKYTADELEKHLLEMQKTKFN